MRRFGVVNGINKELSSNRTCVVGGVYKKIMQKYVVMDGKYKKIWQKGNSVSGSQTFTSTGTFTVPEGVVSIDVFVLGGAGGNGYGEISTAGGSGYVANAYGIEVNPGDEIPVIIGAKGTNGTSSSTTGARGGTSSFGNHVSALGGYGGNKGMYGANGGSGSGCAGYISGYDTKVANATGGWRSDNGRNGSDGSNEMWIWRKEDGSSTYERSDQKYYLYSYVGHGSGVSTIPFGDSTTYSAQDNFGQNGKVIVRWRMAG